jgi:Rieske Fe-S protein
MRTSRVRIPTPEAVVTSQTEHHQRTELAPDLGPGPGLDRRSVLKGACAVCVGVAGVAVLAACGGNLQDNSDGAGDGGAGAGGASAPGGGKVYQASDIPVGGGKVFGNDDIVVTQPTAGVFKAFSATCTHQGFIVGNVQGGTINCFHHGSKYNDATGAVEAGPAPSPLPAKTVAVSGASITVT